MRLNYFVIIGKCIDVNESYLLILNENDEFIKVYHDNDENISRIELDTLTKVEGYISMMNPGGIILIADKIYQIKSKAEHGGGFIV